MDKYSVVTELVETSGLIVNEEGQIYSTRIRGSVDEQTLLKGSITGNGYLIHKIVYKGERYQIRAHRIVWYALVGDIQEPMMIDHINRDKQDNRLSNLRVVTTQQNAENRELLIGDDNPASKIQYTDVIEIRQRYKSGDGVREIAKDYDIGKSQVHNIVTYKSWNNASILYDVDRHRFPASRDVPQYEYEPSRVTDRKEHRRDRIKALGNAVVPQAILPIAQEIYTYLMETQP